jgi:hypothetical protein
MILGLRTVLYPVSDIDPAWTRLLGLGASPLEPVTEVGGVARLRPSASRSARCGIRAASGRFSSPSGPVCWSMSR